LGRESQQAEKYTRSASAVRVIFRVCGHKGIACTVAFVYTQALLAPLLTVFINTFSGYISFNLFLPERKSQTIFTLELLLLYKNSFHQLSVSPKINNRD